MTSKAILTCRSNSHPFLERVLILDQPVKIGRSVARARSAPNNAIFDCKVLSRNHALFWYNNGKFYLQDTKSSNGTFINNQRLSKSGEESSAREVCSGDIVQFGVDVLENSRKVTHGCIIANIKLYLPDGKEAKPSDPTTNSLTPGSHSVEDLYQLNQYIQEAIQKEHMLEDKLLTLQSAFDTIWKAAENGWKALITEDKLLSRVENLESQIQTYSKDFSEDKIRDELRKLQEDKDQYQSAAKDFLHKILEEKIESDQKCQEIKRTLEGVEAKYSNVCSEIDSNRAEFQELAQKFSAQVAKNELIQNKYQELEEQHRVIVDRLKSKIFDLEQLLEKHVAINSSNTNSDVIKENLPVIELEINPKDSIDLEIDDDNEDFTSKNEDKYHQPHLSEEVQLKLVSQLQEITEKYAIDEGLENTKFEDEDSMLDYNSSEDSISTINNKDQDKELLKLQLEEAQLLAEQNKLMSDELSDKVNTLTRELEMKAPLLDNRRKDELNLAKQECIRLESVIASLKAEYKTMKEVEKTKPSQPPPVNGSAKILDEPGKNVINDYKNTISELQEKLVTVETMYMSCHEERTLLNRQLKSLQLDHQTLLNKPYSFLIITLPCIVALFAFLTIFYSSFFHSPENPEEKS